MADAKDCFHIVVILCIQAYKLLIEADGRKNNVQMYKHAEEKIEQTQHSTLWQKRFREQRKRPKAKNNADGNKQQKRNTQLVQRKQDE